MNIDDANLKIKALIKELNDEGYKVLVSILGDNGYIYEEVTEIGTTVIIDDPGPFI